MKYVLFGISAVYALLSILAAVVGMRRAELASNHKDTHITMLCGGVLLLTAGVTLLAGWRGDWLLSIVGCACISAAAFVNGRRGEFHIGHHIVRFAVAAAITVGFMLL